MSWIEQIDERTPKARIWRDENNPRQRVFHHLGAPIHYPVAGPDSALLDGEIDCSPVRVDNAQFDGWRVAQNHWHYALGRPADCEDGWVGFGGRQGDHWLRFRLLRVGYLHWPTRTWDDVGGSPDYDRANLSNAVEEQTIGPDDDVTVRPSSRATWTNIWTTPGGGALGIQWLVRGDRLREEIIVNQVARQWIQSNRPPTTPATETWFGFVFELDVSDVPRWVKAGILQDIDGDFDDDGGGVELQDAQERLLALMPISRGYLTDGTGEIELRKRVWKSGDDYYLLVGARVDHLAGLPAGDLVFDPDLNISVTASSDDAEENSAPAAPGLTSTDLDFYGGSDEYVGCRFQGITIPAGSTIDTAIVRFTARYTKSDCSDQTVYCEDVDDAATFTTASGNISSRSLTAGTAWLVPNTTQDATFDTVDFSSRLQTVIDRGGWASGQDIAVIFRGSTTNSAHAEAWSFDNGSDVPQLRTTYTLGGEDFEREVSDGMSMGELFGLAPGLAAEDGLKLSDSRITGAGLGLLDGAVLGDVRAMSAGLAALDGLFLSDPLGKASGVAALDGVQLAEDVARAWVAYQSLADGLALADAPAKAPGLFPADGLSLDDDLAWAWAVIRALLDGASLGDAPDKRAGLGVLDGVLGGDVPSSGVGKGLLDGLSLGDLVARVIGLAATDSIALAENVAQAWAALLALVDGVDVGEALIKALGMAADDGVDVGEAVVKALGLTVADGLSLADLVDILTGIGLTFSDGLSLGDSATRGIGLSATDGIALAENIARAWAALLALTDGTVVAEALTKAAGLATTDGISASEEWAKATGVDATDGLSLSDAAVTFWAALLALTDGVDLGDDQAKTLGVELADGLTLSDALVSLLASYILLTLGSRAFDLSLRQRALSLSLLERILELSLRGDER